MLQGTDDSGVRTYVREIYGAEKGVRYAQAWTGQLRRANRIAQLRGDVGAVSMGTGTGTGQVERN